MYKSILLLVHFFALSILGIFFSDDVKVHSTMPDEMILDSFYIVEVNINRGDIVGYAKFQQNLPEGFEAEPLETNEATFSFAEGKIKFIWMAIPDNPEIKIVYRLKAKSEQGASFVTSAKFSYIENGEKLDYDLPNMTVNVIHKNDVPVILPAEAKVTRSVKKLDNLDYRVDLQIEKQGITGFCKLEEYIPSNTTATVLNNELSVFSQVDDKAKFVWMSIPSDNSITVSYMVKGESPELLAELEQMDGDFSFLDGSETKTVAVIGEKQDQITSVNESKDSSLIDIVSSKNLIEIDDTIASQVIDLAEVSESLDSSKNQSKMSIDVPMQSQDEPVSATELNEIPVSASNQDAVVTSKEEGIIYKIQILAGHNTLSAEELQKKYDFSESFTLFNHEGWIKYLTGSYTEYRLARDKRESINATNHKFPGPFVTAYNSGARITVQEALMITNQQWIN